MVKHKSYLIKRHRFTHRPYNMVDAVSEIRRMLSEMIDERILHSLREMSENNQEIT